MGIMVISRVLNHECVHSGWATSNNTEKDKFGVSYLKMVRPQLWNWSQCVDLGQRNSAHQHNYHLHNLSYINKLIRWIQPHVHSLDNAHPIFGYMKHGLDILQVYHVTRLKTGCVHLQHTDCHLHGNVLKSYRFPNHSTQNEISGQKFNCCPRFSH